MSEIKTKYNIGDKVKVRSDLQLKKHYHMENNNTSHVVVQEMVRHYAGKEVLIISICNDDKYGTYYQIKEDNKKYLWTDEMFEGLVEELKEEEIPNNIIHKNNLNTGDIVICKNGNICIVMKNTSLCSKNEFVSIDDYSGFNTFEEYSDDLKNMNSQEYDIIDILKPNNYYAICKGINNNLEGYYKSILQPKKKMTIEEMKSELEKINGCEIEVVESEEE